MVFAFQARDNRDARCIPGWFLRRARHWTGVRNLRSARWYKATSWPQARSASGSFSAALPSGKHQPCSFRAHLRRSERLPERETECPGLSANCGADGIGYFTILNCNNSRLVRTRRTSPKPSSRRLLLHFLGFSSRSL